MRTNGRLQKERHGTYSCYKRTGCRCDQCKAANAAYMRDFYAANRTRLQGYKSLRRAGLDPAPCMVRKPQAHPQFDEPVAAENYAGDGRDRLPYWWGGAL